MRKLATSPTEFSWACFGGWADRVCTALRAASVTALPHHFIPRQQCSWTNAQLLASPCIRRQKSACPVLRGAQVSNELRLLDCTPRPTPDRAWRHGTAATDRLRHRAVASTVGAAMDSKETLPTDRILITETLSARYLAIQPPTRAITSPITRSEKA
jgi:hypothetical protein